MMKRLTLTGSTLRPRSSEEKVCRVITFVLLSAAFSRGGCVPGGAKSRQI